MNTDSSEIISEQIKLEIVSEEGNFELHDPLLGTVIREKIEIRSVIAKSTRSKLYKAWHRELEQFVAVKFLHDQFVDSKEKMIRFEIEAKAASSISHPSVIKIFEYGLTSTGAPYIVMEFIPKTLGKLMEENSSLDLAQFYRLFDQILDALSFAHAQNIIHRDLKPENILIDDTGSTQRAKIADWGIAKVIFSNDESPECTGTGDVLGSPAYMSPEQCLGHKADARSDLYSLGCIMYEYFRGQKAFSGRNSFECMRMHLSTDPPKLQVKDESSIPDALDEIINLCLKREPSERPQLASDIKNWLGDLHSGKVVDFSSRDTAASKMSHVSGKRTFEQKLLPIAAAILVFALCSFGLCNLLGGFVPPVKTVAKGSSWGLQSYRDLQYDLGVAEEFYHANGDKLKEERSRQLLAEVQSLMKSGNLPKSDRDEIHVVQFDKGYSPNQFARRGTAKVCVSAKNAPIVLALVASNPVDWELFIEPGARVKQILLLGDDTGSLKTKANSIPVIRRGNDYITSSFSALNYYRQESIRSGIFQALNPNHPATSSLADVQIVSNQFSPDAGLATWYVGPESPEWKAQSVVNAFAADHGQVLSDMSANFDLSTKELTKNSTLTTNSFLYGNEFLREYGAIVFPPAIETFVPSLAGLSKSANDVVPHLSDSGTDPYVVLPKKRRYFSLGTNAIDEISSEYVGREEIALPRPQNRVSYVHSALLANDPNEKYLYYYVGNSVSSYDLGTNKWLPEVKLKNDQYGGSAQEIRHRGALLCANDSFYFLAQSDASMDCNFDFIEQYSKDGKLLSQTRLSRNICCDRFLDNRMVDLNLRGDHFVATLINSSTDKLAEGQKFAYYYVIDSNGKVNVVGELKNAGGSHSPSVTEKALKSKK